MILKPVNDRAKQPPVNPVTGDTNSGDVDWSKVSSITPEMVRLIHVRSDVDQSWQSMHHTLGIKSSQAAAGNHIHDGITSKLIGDGLGLTLTGSKGGNVALTNLIAMLKTVISFTDTTT